MKIATNCRCCTAACGILVEVEGDQVIAVSGDTEHPLSHGYVCPKGHNLPAFHHRADRLNVPLIRGDQVSWDEMTGHLSASLNELIERHGPDSVGVYTGTGLAADPAGKDSLTRLMAGIGTSQKYSPLTIDIAPAYKVAEIITGSPRLLPMWLPEDPDSSLVLWIGGNPLVSHGYINRMADPARRIRRFQQRGGQMWMVDPKITRSARLAERHLQIRPGTDPLLLAWLTRSVLLARGLPDDLAASVTPEQVEDLLSRLEPFDEQNVSARTGLAAADLRHLLDGILRAGRIAVCIGTGVTFDRHAMITDWLRWLLLLATDSLDRAGGMWFYPGWIDPLDADGRVIPPMRPPSPGPDSRPDLTRVYGEIPCVAMADEIESGQLRALFVSGASPLTAFPNPERIRRGLESLAVLAVADVVQTPLTAMATHVLPVTGQLERTDLLQARLPRAMIAPAVVPPSGERKPLWWIAAQLGSRMNIDVLKGLDPETVTEEDLLRRIAAKGRGPFDDLLAAGPHGRAIPQPDDWVRQRLHEQKWNILAGEFLERLDAMEVSEPPTGHLMLVSGRLVSRVNGTPYVPVQKSRDAPVVQVNPADAKDLELTDGAMAEVRSGSGVLVARVEVTDAVLPGNVYIAHGWREANVGHLTSAVHDIDRLAGQPTMTAIAVTLASAPATTTASV
jgi:anaerobic selenocysteine-containing dehydrogenase